MIAGDHVVVGLARTHHRIHAGVRIDQPHRLDVALPGFELDQFVVVPEKDGSRFRRKLQPKSGKR